jgi:O-antigen/teichoic acid export membrane protein
MTEWKKIKETFMRFKGLTSIGFANIVANAISGLFWLYIARILGTEHYGEVSYFIAIAGIGTILSFVGAGNILLVYAAKEVKIQPPVYFISLIASIITAIVLFFIFYNIGISLFVIGNVVFGLVTYDMLGRKLYKNYLRYVIVQKILMALLAIVLYHIIGINGVILGISLSFFLPIVKIYQIFRGAKIDFSLIKSRYGFIVNSYMLDITRTFSTTTDKLIVAPMFGFALLGNYQLGVQFLSLLTILPGIVYQYILPQDASGNPNKKLKRLTIVISVVLAILSIVLAPIVLPVLFSKFTHAITVIQIISLSIIPISITNTYISKFLARENSKIVLIGSGIFLGVQIVMIVLLGKIYGITGISASFVLAQTSETIYLIIVDRVIKKNNLGRS